MDNPGTYPLIATALTGAVAAQAATEVDSLDGMNAVTLLAEMLGGSGGTSINLLAQTTLDGGTTWLDIALFTFANTAGKKWAVLQGNAAKAVAVYTALAAEGVNDGLLGPAIRGVITSVGTYANTTVSLRATVR